MKRGQAGLHVKGWYVEAVLDDAINQIDARKVTRIFGSLDAVNAYADALRKHVKKPELVNVRTAYSRAKIDERIDSRPVLV